MKTGIVRRLDDLGRIVIPKEVRRHLGLKEGDALEIAVDENNVILSPYRPYAEDQIVANLEKAAQYFEDIEQYRRANELRDIIKAVLKNRERR